MTSKQEKRGGTQKRSFAFNEFGVAMLSGVLRSETAIQVNITIIRAFVILKQYNSNFQLLQQSIKELESKFKRKIENINEVIELLLTKPEPVKKINAKPMKKIGYKLSRK